MNPRYKFGLKIGEIEKQVYPNYKDDISKDYKLESNQRFYRSELSSSMTFQKADFDYIDIQPFETVFIFLIYKSGNNGITWTEYWRGKFTKTDCKFDVDNKTCEVKPDLLDDYVDVLAGLEKEYNLIKLAPKIEPILVQRRPLIQIYIPGDSVVSCFLAGDYWEQDAEEIDDKEALVNTYHFALCNLLKEIKISAISGYYGGNPIIGLGLYTGNMNTTDGGETFVGNLYSLDVDDYYIKITQEIVGVLPGGYDVGSCTYELRQKSDDIILYSYTQVNAPDNMDFTMAGQNGVTGTASAEMATYSVFARYLLDSPSILGLTTYDIPVDDIVEDNRNYSRVIGYAIQVAFISSNYSVESTEWGLADNGKYFNPPYSIYGQTFYPIARSTWRYSSIWFAFHLLDDILEKEGRKNYQIKDNYPLSSVISVLLKEFAPGITHEDTAEYSQFLYGDTNPIINGMFRLLITQKTNVTAGDYDRPAQKAPITLDDIFKMLRDCFRCYWYIQDKKLKIEHIKYFRNGGSYLGTPQVGIDLTTSENIKNGKRWDYLTAQYDYDKLDLAERYQFEWMDDVTQSFEGFPIEVLSKYVTAGKIENVSISNFTSDIDYMILNPGGISEDGFALFAAVVADALIDTDAGSYIGGGSAASGGYGDKKYRLKTPLNGKVANFIGSVSAVSGATIQIVFFDSAEVVINTQAEQIITSGTTNINVNVTIPVNAFSVGFKSVTGAFTYLVSSMQVAGSWQLPFVTRVVDGITYSIQNGIVSFLYLLPTFYVYDLPAKHVKINNQAVTATGIERKKKQTVNFPTVEDPDPVKLIKTSLGSGWVDKISVDLHSRMNKIDLRYDTE